MTSLTTATGTPAATAGARAATRTVAVTVPDWPLIAALDRHQRRTEHEHEQEQEQEQRQENAPLPTDTSADATAPDPSSDPESIAVLLIDQHRVTHVSTAAREAGALPGMKRRAARAACPEAIVLEADREHESALFELVAAAVDTIAAGVDVLRPGVLLMSARGPARHQGGEEALAEAIIDAVADLTGWD